MTDQVGCRPVAAPWPNHRSPARQCGSVLPATGEVAEQRRRSGVQGGEAVGIRISFADLGADHFARDDDFDTPILLPSRQSRIISHRYGLAEAFGFMSRSVNRKQKIFANRTNRRIVCDGGDQLPRSASSGRTIARL